MPTYDYRCPNGHDFERFFRTISSSQSEVACPVCGLTIHRDLNAAINILAVGLHSIGRNP